MSTDSPEKDAPIWRRDLSQLSIEEIETELDGIRARRLEQYRVYREAVAEKERIEHEKAKAKLEKVLAQTERALKSLDKAIERAQNAVTKLRIARVEAEALDAPALTEEGEDK